MSLLPDIAFERTNATILKLDYGTRTDSNPVYVGVAESGSDEGVGLGVWLLTKLEYDASGRVISRTINRSYSWTNRGTATYA